MEGVRATFSMRLENAEALVLTDSLERRKKYSSKHTSFAFLPHRYNSIVSLYNISSFHFICHSVISSMNQTPEDLRFRESTHHLTEASVLGKSEILDIEIEDRRPEIMSEFRGNKEQQKQQQHKKANAKVRSVVTALKEKKPKELNLDRSYSQKYECEDILTGENLNYTKE